jgi:hypothetical protein
VQQTHDSHAAKKLAPSETFFAAAPYMRALANLPAFFLADLANSGRVPRVARFFGRKPGDGIRIKLHATAHPHF